MALDALRGELRRRSEKHYYLSIWPPLTAMSDHGDRDYPRYPKTVTNLYLHTPFCSGACSFCNYYFQVADPATRRDRIAAFLDTLLREIELHGQQAHIAASYLYFGGGTPSLIPADLLSGFLDRLGDRRVLAQSPMATIEVHPELFGDTGAASAFLDVCKAKGIGRVSLGIQDLDEEVLARSNRRHGIDLYAHALRLVRDRGLLVNLDLMYGLPGQDKAGWERSLRFSVAQMADSISVYFLFLNGRTALGKKAASGKVALPSYRYAQELHLMAQFYLEEHGYAELPGDFFGLNEVPPLLRDRTSLPSGSHTLPLGPGSYGYFDQTQFANHFSEDEWRRSIRSGRRPIWRSHRHCPDESFRRDVMFSIKNSLGLNRHSILSAWGEAAFGQLLPVLASLEQDGLVAADPAGYLLTRKGRLCAEEIACLFAPPLPSVRAAAASDRLAARHDFSPTY